MKRLWCTCLVFGSALAATGCSSASSPSSKGMVGSYMVTITNTDATSRFDTDIMTVTNGSGGDVLLTFTSGITTDPTGSNPDGLRCDLKSSTEIVLASQAATVDHSTGNLAGMIAGTGTFKPDSCDLKLTFEPMGGTAMNFEVTGSHL